MELTKEWIEDKFGFMSTELWQAIEADRERVRKEAVEEVKKDHFRIGERINWGDFDRNKHDAHGTVAILDDRSNVEGGGLWVHIGGLINVRRPVKMRKLNNEQKVFVLAESLNNDLHCGMEEALNIVAVRLANGESLDENLRVAGIATEVNDEA